jgi:predicted MFS family arabinose efflux permease
LLNYQRRDRRENARIRKWFAAGGGAIFVRHLAVCRRANRKVAMAESGESRISLTAMVLTNCLAVSSAPLMPLIVGALVTDLAFPETLAGLVISAEFAAIAIASLVIAAVARRIDRRRTAVVAAAVIIVGSLLSMQAGTPGLLVPARILTGLGEGMLAATVSAAAAGARKPQKVYALMGLTVALYSMGLLLVVPSQLERFGAAGLFGTVVVVGVLILPLFRWFPRSAGSSDRPPQAKTLRGRLGLAAFGLLALALLTVGQSAIATYLERIGSGLGMSGQAIGNVLALAALVSLAGPASAHVLGNRVGPVPPFVGGGLLLCVSAVTLGYATQHLPYAVAVIATMTGLLFLMPYVLGNFAAMDPGGRIAAAAPAFATIGGAIGPALGAGLLSLGMGYRGVAWLSTAAYTVSIVGSIFIARRVMQSAKPVAAE